MNARTDVLKLSVFQFVYYNFFYGLFIYLPVYLKDKGFSYVEIGWMLSMGSLMTLVSMPVSGYLSDRWDTVLRVILAFIVLSFLGVAFIFGLSSFPAVAFGVAWLYFFLFPVTPLFDSFTMLTVRDRHLFSLVRLWVSASVIFSGIWVPFAIHRWGLANLGWMAATSAVLPILTILMLRETKRVGERSRITALWPFLKQPSLLIFFFLITMVMLTHRMEENYLGLFILNEGGTHQDIAYAWTVGSISEIVAFLIISRYMYRLRDETLMLFGIACLTLKWSLYALFPQVDVLIILGILKSSVTFFLVSAISHLHRRFPPDLRSTGQSLFAILGMALAGFIGNSLGGSLMGWGGTTAFGVCAIITFCMFVVCFVWRRFQ